MTFDVKKKLVVDGKEYESLDQVSAEQREAIEKALPPDMPPLLRAILRSFAEIAAQSASGEASALKDSASASQPGALRPEPLVGTKALVILIGLAALVFLLVRSAL